MKQIFILVIVISSYFIGYGQNETNNVKFIFNNLNEFSSQFSNKETPKHFIFKIKNLESIKDVETLKSNISNYRGVTSFSISEPNAEGVRTADLTLYKYAGHWKYYEYFFSKNGIRIIIINGNIYNPAQIGNQ